MMYVLIVINIIYTFIHRYIYFFAYIKKNTSVYDTEGIKK